MNYNQGTVCWEPWIGFMGTSTKSSWLISRDFVTSTIDFGCSVLSAVVFVSVSQSVQSSPVQSSKADRAKLLRTEQTLQNLRTIDPTREALWKVEKINEWQ